MLVLQRVQLHWWIGLRVSRQIGMTGLLNMDELFEDETSELE